MESLRKRLGELNRRGELHFDAIENIRTDFDHSIQLVERWSMPGPTNFNCVMYALNLRDDPLHNAIALSNDIVRATLSRFGESSISADTEFLEFCMATGPMPSISDRKICPGDLLVYRNEGKCRHIGRVVERGRLHSKLGTRDLVEHEPLEMPDCYGNDLLYVESLTYEQSRDLFIEYSRSVVHNDPQVKKHLESMICKHR